MLHIEYRCEASKCGWKQNGGPGIPLARLDREAKEHEDANPGHRVHMRERHDSW